MTNPVYSIKQVKNEKEQRRTQKEFELYFKPEIMTLLKRAEHYLLEMDVNTIEDLTLVSGSVDIILRANTLYKSRYHAQEIVDLEIESKVNYLLKVYKDICHDK